MPFQSLITAVMETTLNKLIEDDPQLHRRLSRLKGQVIQLHIKELDQSFTLVFSHQIDVLAAYEGQPDCYLSLSLTILPELREHANITQLIKQDKLELRGDLQLAQKFAQLLSDCKPDLEEWLSRLTGDVLAHTLVQGVTNIHHQTRSYCQKQRHYAAQVITEEWRFAPPPLEIADFCDQVDEVKSHAARLEAKLHQLLEKV